MKTRVAFLMALVPLFLSAQGNEPLVINGFIAESDGQIPVKGAVCFLKNNEFIGAVTDEKGRFSFIAPRTFLSDTLVISSLGFERILKPLKHVDRVADTLRLLLHPKAIMLDEVLVEANRQKLRHMVLEAYKRIPQNFPNKKHQLKGLYRKLSTEDNTYTHLEEATVVVEDYGYHRDRETIRIIIEGYRESIEHGNIDKDFLQVIEKISDRTATSWGYNFYNPLYDLYNRNFLRAYKKEGSVFSYSSLSKNIDKSYGFELMGVEVMENDTIYQIAFSSMTGINGIEPSGMTYLKINSTDFGITEYQLYLGTEKELMDKVQIEFVKKGGRYFPAYIQHIRQRNINQGFQDGEYDIHTYWFDIVKTDNFEKMKNRDVLSKKDKLNYRKTKYNPSHWSDCPHIMRHPIEPAVRLSLEFELALEDQFKMIRY